MARKKEERKAILVACILYATLWGVLFKSSVFWKISLVNKYKPRTVKIQITAGTILKDQIDIPKIEKDKEIKLIKRPSLPLFSG